MRHPLAPRAIGSTLVLVRSSLGPLSRRLPLFTQLQICKNALAPQGDFFTFNWISSTQNNPEAKNHIYQQHRRGENK